MSISNPSAGAMPPSNLPDDKTPPRRRPTMLDIAREAGVARSTVSAILSHSSYCYASRKTREHVMAAATRLGYEPNYLARGLAGQQTHCIGLIVDTIRGPVVQARKISAVEQAAWEQGYRLLIGSHCVDAGRYAALMHNFLNQRVDGLIVHHLMRCVDGELERAHNEGVPVVTIDSAGAPGVPDVSFDRELAGYLQTKHLLDLGRRNIAFLLGSSVHPYEVAKARGHERALREAGIDPRAMLWIYAQPTMAADNPLTGAALMKSALASGRTIDAVVTTADILAMGAMRVVLDAQLRVPRDVAIVGFNNDPVSEGLEVPLTTVEQPIATGAQAFALLLKMIQDRPHSLRTPPPGIRVPGQLIVRASTVGAPPG